MAAIATVTPAERKKLRRRRTLRQYGKVLIFLSPWILGFLMFIIYPMLASLYYSFTHYDMLTSPKWVGLSNYRFMFSSDPLFWQSLRNTVWIIAIGVPVQIVFAISTALVLTLRSVRPIVDRVPVRADQRVARTGAAPLGARS